LDKMKVAVLGATGMIGQRFIQLLEDHPYFEFGGLYASERSEGKSLREVLKIRDHRFRPETMDMTIEKLDSKNVASTSRVAFSGLPSEAAKDLEVELAKEGLGVFSNASSHRMSLDVPLLIPEVNPEHLDAVKDQSSFANGGFIVTNANCSTTGIAPPLKALNEAFGLDVVTVSTYQAISGAGYPGVPSMDILGNIVPHIGGEEEKIEVEIKKMLGSYEGSFQHADFTILANCARVPVVDGHLEAMILRLKDDPDVETVIGALEGFPALDLPSAPRRPIIVMREEDRPQPALDAFAGEPERAQGMAVSVGRVRKEEGWFKMFVLSHNTLRGGAGGSVLNAELAKAKGLL